jgi:hypothetical protein
LARIARGSYKEVFGALWKFFHNSTKTTVFSEMPFTEEEVEFFTGISLLTKTDAAVATITDATITTTEQDESQQQQPPLQKQPQQTPLPQQSIPQQKTMQALDHRTYVGSNSYQYTQKKIILKITILMC